MWAALGQMVAKLGLGYEDAKLEDKMYELSDTDFVMQEGIIDDMLKWAETDWERFKTDGIPLENELIRSAEEGIEADTAGVTGRTGADVQQQYGIVRDTVGQNQMDAGVNPNSGRFVDSASKVSSSGAGTAGYAINRAREAEENRVDDFNWDNKIRTLSSTKGLATGANINAARGADAAGRSAESALARGQQFGASAGQNFMGAGRDFGSIDWSSFNFGGGGDEEVGATKDEWTGELGWKDGGLIRGPGSGSSDSIPANVDQAIPARVSNGEYRIPAAVVRRVGTKYLDDLIKKHHGAADGKQTL